MDGNEQKESLKRDMHRTAQDLAEKFDEFGGVVHSTYEDGKQKINNVVDKVTETAQIFSPTHQIRSRPLTWLAGAVVGGFIVARRLQAPRDSQPWVEADPKKTLAHLSLGNSLAQEFAPELKELKEVLLISAVKYAADKFRAKKPEYRDQISQIENTLRTRFSRV